MKPNSMLAPETCDLTPFPIHKQPRTLFLTLFTLNSSPGHPKFPRLVSFAISFLHPVETSPDAAALWKCQPGDYRWSVGLDLPLFLWPKVCHGEKKNKRSRPSRKFWVRRRAILSQDLVCVVMTTWLIFPCCVWKKKKKRTPQHVTVMPILMSVMSEAGLTKSGFCCSFWANAVAVHFDDCFVLSGNVLAFWLKPFFSRDGHSACPPGSFVSQVRRCSMPRRGWSATGWFVVIRGPCPPSVSDDVHPTRLMSSRKVRHSVGYRVLHSNKWIVPERRAVELGHKRKECVPSFHVARTWKHRLSGHQILDWQVLSGGQWGLGLHVRRTLCPNEWRNGSVAHSTDVAICWATDTSVCVSPSGLARSTHPTQTDPFHHFNRHLCRTQSSASIPDGLPVSRTCPLSNQFLVPSILVAFWRGSWGQPSVFTGRHAVHGAWSTLPCCKRTGLWQSFLHCKPHCTLVRPFQKCWRFLHVPEDLFQIHFIQCGECSGSCATLPHDRDHNFLFSLRLSLTDGTLPDVFLNKAHSMKLAGCLTSWD